MRAARIHSFGPPEVIVIDDLPRPTPGAGQVLVRVAAAGVGPWDALIREGKSVVNPPLPIILGSDLSGMVADVGAGVSWFRAGDEIYGVTNPQFVGAYAEYAVASAEMVAPKPKSLSSVEAASVPVVAVTAWQMLHDYAKAVAGQTVLIHGAGGSVGAYAVQFASQAGLQVYATASGADVSYAKSLGATTVIDYKTQRFEDATPRVDIVLDMVGGETRARSLRRIKPGGILVSVVSQPTPEEKSGDVRAVFFLAEVTTDRLERISAYLDAGELVTRVGSVLPVEQARMAHGMLAGAPHARGKIVLQLADGV